MRRRLGLLSVSLLALLPAGLVPAGALAQPSSDGAIKIVGSSTVTPFALIVADRLNREAGGRIVIESTGTGGGISLFCASADPHFAPIVLASRAMKESEAAACETRGLGPIVEYDIGLSGIALAERGRRRALSLTTAQIFRALAANVPAADGTCALTPNVSRTWHDVDPALPRRRIEVFGPPMTSGTRTSFIELAMREGALEDACLSALSKEDPEAFERITNDIRADGAWIDAGENDQAIVAAIASIPHSIGVLSYSGVKASGDLLSPATINGVAPSISTIAAEIYPLSRPLKIYAKERALGQSAAAERFVNEITSKKAIGVDGYLTREGLISFDSVVRREAMARER